ncbi:LysR substrate-binding domain-containing protein [Roseibium sp. AS2]|uniref:LysR family transcriptional regulator n=1 Tax=Roseibium sp. AS2 TaxID=3135781 RepID=UPI00317EC6F1
MDPKLRNLEIFRIFALTQNVTETARLVRISQPAVSQILRDLESLLGLTLYKRVGRTLQLTAEARAILPDITKLIAQMGALRNQVEGLRDAKAGHLSIASVPTMINNLIPDAISDFRKSRPSVRLRIMSMTASDVANQVRTENAEVGLTFLPVNGNGLDIQPLLKTEMVCLLPRGHHLQKHAVITPELLRNETVMAQGPETPPGFALRDTFDQFGISDLIVVEVNQSGVALPMVKRGMGVALAHPFVLDINDPDVVAIPFEPHVELILALVFPKFATRSQLTVAFVGEFKTRIQAHSTMLAEHSLRGEML